MKKLLALLLAMAMILSLAACGSSSSTETAAADDTAATEEAAPAEDAAAEEAAPAEEAASDEIAPVGDPVTLTVTCAYKDTDNVGIMLNYFMDKCTELSGGTITFDKYMGGTLGGSDEELGMLSDGDVDIIALYAPAYAFDLPGFIYVMNAVGTCEEVTEWFNWTCYENEETAAILADELAAFNATPLKAGLAVSETMYPCTKEITCWQDIKDNLKFGAISDYAEAEGYQNWVLVDAADNYENLRSGFCEALESSVDDVVSAKLYEVAEYFLDTEIYSPFNHLVMNTDKLNSLSAEQQAVIYEAAQETVAYSIEYANQCTAEAKQVIEDNGGTVLTMTEEELAEYWQEDCEVNYASAYVGLGGATGTQEQAAIIINCIMEYWDTDVRVGE